MLQYIDIHLEDKSVDTVMLNIQKIVDKRKQVGVRNIFVSGLVYTTRVNLPILERVHSLISNYCRENASFYIDNRNIRGFCFVLFMVFIY